MINHVTKLGNVGVGGKNPVRIMSILNTSPESFYKKSVKTTKQQITDDFISSMKESSPPQFNPLFDNTQSHGKTKPTTPPPPIIQGSPLAKELPIMWPHPVLKLT
mgnify:CR=1 FL=1